MSQHAARPSGKAAVADRSLVVIAYRTMRARILDNRWAPGYRALEQELAQELGMSRTPVREALIRLQKEGLVEVIPRHGMRVLPVSADDMRDIYQVLTALESMAAELVARRKPSEAELAPLVDASRAMARALKANDLDAWAAADERFHRHLIELSGNQLLIDAVLNCWDRAHRARMVTLRMRPKPAHSTRDHMYVVEKIRAGDARRAFEAHRAHRERGSQELLAILERYRLQHL
ncbi:MAG: GntR family transcriptional regulator [Betaproteobacteria bacterium]|nr:GntR family transcriptional regulator [Betaproteobacteria bacterium]MDE2208267.1 GntR family transcriptional regulator [Betaproteobacteria bacterium]MDE2359158.1 GntR family transcriptional regulator [Betaproteobacteria bacterium]